MDKSDTPRCKEEVMPATGFPRPHRCHFKASKDGYCKIHHPDSVKAREEKQRLKYEAERAKSPYFLLQKATERNKELEREVTALTAANADLTAQLAEARSIAWEWGQGVDDAEAAIRKLSRMFPIDAMKEPK